MLGCKAGGLFCVYGNEKRQEEPPIHRHAGTRSPQGRKDGESVGRFQKRRIGSYGREMDVQQSWEGKKETTGT